MLPFEAVSHLPVFGTLKGNAKEHTKAISQLVCILAFFTLVSVSGITTTPFVGKSAIELPLPTFLPANGYGFEWFLVSEGGPEEGKNQLIEMQKEDVSERLLPLNWLL